MQKIGFIGLGIMGKPMALNLIKAGYPLTVYDIRPEAVREVVAAGAREGKSSKDVAAQSDVVITMLPNSPDVKAAVLGKNGVLEGAKAGLILVDMSSIAPLVAQEIAAAVHKKAVEMLDAPVSGGEPKAKDATLSIMVGGKREVFERCLPLFRAMGRQVTYIGGSGAGQIAKLANQAIVAVNIAVVAEAM